MLDDIDQPSRIEKKDMKKMSSDLGILSRQAKDMGIPVMLVFEGWDVSGKSSSINRMLMALDPRNYEVHPIMAPSEGERERPYLWRFWIRTPSRGKMAIFDRSWYTGMIEDRVNGKISDDQLYRGLDHINSFERQLSDDGTIVAKFFLHLSRKKQEKRLKKLEKEPLSPFRYLPDHWERHRHYDEYRDLYQEMLKHTNTEYARWKVLPSEDTDMTDQMILSTVTSLLKKRRDRILASRAEGEHPYSEVVKLHGNPPDIISRLNLGLSIKNKDYRVELERLQKKLMELQIEFYRKRIPVMIVYSGVDAAGKGGNIRRLVQRLDPRGYKVIPISVPTDVEMSHHYLWRFWKELSRAGRINIFDRSWYGRVLVERVEGLCSETQWKRAYREINEMESQWVDFGAVVVKFWLQIDKQEQLRRFSKRLSDPYKNWKITDDDWRNRGNWDRYIEAANEMIHRTDTRKAPWTLVEGNSKKYGRIKTLGTVVKSMERRLESYGN